MTKIDAISLSINFIDKKTDSAILFLHGLQSKKETFDIYLSNLSNKTNNSLISVDLMGFGQSAKPKNFGYDLRDQVNEIEKLISQLNIKNLIIIGHSYGGMIGTKLLESKSLNFKLLISLEGNLMEEDCGESAIVAGMTFKVFTGYFKSLKNELINSNKPSDNFRGESISHIPPHIFYKTSKAIVSWSKSGYLNNIFYNNLTPKLLIVGSNSNFFSIPNSSYNDLIIIDGVSHFMLSEKPKEVFRFIEKYLKKKCLL